MNLLATYGELAAGILGMLGSLILARPLLGEIADRRHWERLAAERREARQRRRQQGQVDSAGSGRAGEEADLTDIRDQLLDDRMGAYTAYLSVARWGFAALLAGFAFLVAAAIARLVAQ